MTRKPCKKITPDRVKEDMKKAGDDLINLAKDAKVKFDKADDATKKKIVAGVAGAVGLIGAAVGLSKMRKKKKSK